MSTKLMQERGACVARMRELLNTAEAQGRDLNEGERTEYEAKETRQNEIQSILARAEKLRGVEAQMESVERQPGLSVKDKGNPRASAEYMAAFSEYARKGKSGLDREFLNALQVGTNSEGGYIVPVEFDNQLVAALQDINEVRNYVNVISTASQHKIPVESSIGSAAWTAEEAAYNDSDDAFSQVSLDAYKLTRIVKVSEELLQDAFFNVPNYLAGTFAKAFGIAEESAFVNGDGSSKPTGIVPGSSLGKTAAGAAAITADELIDLYHALARPYRRNATWMMNDSTAKLIRKLKDGDSQYLWQPGLVAGQPDTLFGRPVLISTAMPAATTGLKSVVFGDLSYYTVADRQGMGMQRLNELYAATGQVGFRGWKRTDGKVTLSSAIKHLIQA